RSRSEGSDPGYLECEGMRLVSVGRITAVGVLSVVLPCAPKAHSPRRPPSSSDREDRTAEDASRQRLPLPVGREVTCERELAQVAQIRGLELKKPILGLEVSTPELLLHVTRAVELETPEKAILGTEAMLVGLGVVPPG